MIIKCLASGSKGGTGKSTLAIIASRIARALGIRIGVLDLALGNPSTTVALLGQAPRHNLATYLMGISSVTDVVLEVPTSRGPIYLVPSGRGSSELVANVRYALDRFEALISTLEGRLHLDLVIMDFPAFNPYVDGLSPSLLKYCDVVHPVLVQDYGSLIAAYELVRFCGEGRVKTGVSVLNMVREVMGNGWVKSVGKLLGREPFVIHYDPWITRLILNGEFRDTQGVRELLGFVLRYLLH
ncbi:tyrosine-protein kinase family protein [Vulcanisaeta thermophila]|uniref:tyrosine-protein kinase family protein n=1 Tax=Vulcanisaeta thermophila TaxID=867917 RepID=UPI000852E263|nr:hypothetical protein [Vulcanisaeta thermophila]